MTIKRKSLRLILAFAMILTLALTSVVSYADGEESLSPAELKNQLKDEVSLECNWYGSKKLEVYAEPETKGTITISGKTYKYDLQDKSKATIKLKKVYPLRTSIKLKANNYGVTITKSYKFKNETWLSSAFITGKKVEADCFNLHKGDVVKLTFKGKTYTKKITKNFDNRKKTVVFKLKKKPAFDAKMKVVIVNKSKKNLFKRSIRFSNFAYYR